MLTNQRPFRYFMLYIILAILGLITTVSTEAYYNSSVSCYSPNTSASFLLVTILAGLGLFAALFSFTHQSTVKLKPASRLTVTTGYAILSVIVAGAITVAVGFHQAGFHCLQ
jgi:DMSO reductase anchor subunit